jgi:hypothetical protein
LLVLIIQADRFADPLKHHVSLSEGFHISLGGGGVHYYSDKQYGPYRGSVIGLAGDPNSPNVTGFNLPCYFRQLRWPNGHRMWTLFIPLPLLLMPFGVLPLVWLVREIRSSRGKVPRVLPFTGRTSEAESSP